MTNLTDTQVDIQGKDLTFSVPFAKRDESKRMVHGFATLDNIDTQDDIVTYAASKSAFERFRGNIREMHDSKAVGKMVTFRPEKLFDPGTGVEHKGIFVSTYVSKGAQDTWEKVLDGTLSGFSIGGKIKKSKNVFDESLGRTVRVIEEYDISELSLVDNPANQLSNFTGFEKASVVDFTKGASEDEGYLIKTSSENVFFCHSDNVVQLDESGSAECHSCGKEMANIGFVESDDPEKSVVIKRLLDDARNIPQMGDMVEFDEGFGRVEAIISKGVVSIPGLENEFVANENDPSVVIRIFAKNSDTIDAIETDHRMVKNLSSITRLKEAEKVENEKNVEQTTTVVTETVEVTEEKPVEAPEVADEKDQAVEDKPASDEEIKKGMEDINAKMDSLTESISKMADSLATLPELFKAMGAKVETAEEVAKSATAELKKAKDDNEKLGERLGQVEQVTAFRKSAEVGEIVQALPKKEESIWGGHFLDGSARNL